MTIDNPTRKANKVRATVAAILGTATVSAGFLAPARVAAQNAPAPAAQQSAAALEEVVVTGSHIQRPDFEGTSPIVTIGGDILQNNSTISIETNLQKLPQFVPGVSQFVTQDVQNTATNTVGASTVNLRGLGSNRNLVLVDGKRATPVNALMVVDVNSIPSGAIQRVEILTGGASATYGADAVGGVVNFVLKHDYKGAELDVQDGITQKGDDQELRIASLMGTNFADGRGNVMFNAQFSKRGAAFQRDRDFYKQGWADPSVNGTEFWFSNTQFAPDFLNLPAQATVDSLFGRAAPGAVANSSTFFFNNDGTVFTGGQQFSAGVAAGAYKYNGPLDGEYRSLASNGTIKQNATYNYLSIPLTNYNLFGRAHYDVGLGAELYIQGTYSATHSDTILQYSPSAFGWNATIPYDAQHPVPADLAALLNSRANPTAPWALQYILNFAGPRGTVNDTETYQVMAGVDGKLPVKDWTWDVYVSHGNTLTVSEGRGFASLANWRAVVQAPNYGANATITGPAGGESIHCTSGIPIFANFQVSQDCLDAITADTHQITRMDQNVVEGTLQGGIFDLPAGELRFAAGADWRINNLSFSIDPLESTSNTTDTVIGVFPAASTRGEISVSEEYAELLVPVVKDLPVLRKVDLDLGYRNSNYRYAGKVGTWMANLNWQLFDALRFRGSFQVANRAPNIGELFSPLTQAVTGTAYGDPCTPNTTAPFGVNPVYDPSGAAKAVAMCQSLMTPGAAAFFYRPGQSFGPPAAIVVTTQAGSRAQNILPQNLSNEKAKTFTGGLVLNSPFDAAMLKRFTVSLDYYHIEVTNLVNALSFDSVYQECLSPAANPTQSPANPFCRLITRDSLFGFGSQTITPFANAGTLKTSGVDLQLDWASSFDDMGFGGLPGSVGVNILGTYLKNFQTQPVAGAAFVDSAGTENGPLPNGGNIFGAYFRYQLYNTFSYYVGGAAISLRWRYLPSIHSAAFATTPNTLHVGAPHYNSLDLESSWDINDRWQVRFGIDNLVNAAPVITDSVPVAGPGTPATTGAGTTNPSIYDVLGRRFFVGVKARF